MAELQLVLVCSFATFALFWSYVLPCCMMLVNIRDVRGHETGVSSLKPSIQGHMANKLMDQKSIELKQTCVTWINMGCFHVNHLRSAPKTASLWRPKRDPKDLVDHEGRSSLHLAVTTGRAEVAKYLLQQRINQDFSFPIFPFLVTSVQIKDNKYIHEWDCN